MILLIPVSPEVPQKRAPKLWPGLLFTLLLGIVFLEAHAILEADYAYIESLSGLVETNERGSLELRPEAHAYLRLRPLLRLVPSRGDWDWQRLILANFVHGSWAHLLLNAIGVFAGARICTTFLSFPAVFFIFIFGGTLGLLTSTLLTSQLSQFIPHLGASAGIFALMGTYYIFNFQYRTKYFFWFPSRQGLIALRTNWFFFVDVVLLEIILSAAQLFPGQGDVVDHFAHVVGFASGAVLALTIRLVQGWPAYLQCRGEFLYYSYKVKQRWLQTTPMHLRWMELLEINPYNDLIKHKLFGFTCRHMNSLSDAEVARVFSFLSPTYIRLYSPKAVELVRSAMQARRTLPKNWLLKTPYDCVIRMARFLVANSDDQIRLYDFVSAYRHAHAEGGDVDRKLEILLQKLKAVMPQPEPAAVGTPDNASAGSSLPLEIPGSPPKKATGAN